jgi:excisionase family DNA binding protein
LNSDTLLAFVRNRGETPGTNPKKQVVLGHPHPGSAPRFQGETGRNMERPKEVMTLREASEYLGISPDTLYKYLNENRIPGVAFKLGNRWRFKKDLLDRWMEKKSERVLEVKSSRVEKVTVKH